MKKTIIATATLLASVAAQAAVLETDYRIRVLMVNGQEIQDTQKIDKDHYQLPDEQTQLVIQVKGPFGNGSDSKYFESKPYLMTFDVAQPLKLDLPEKLRSKSKAERAFRRNNAPKWRLTDKSGSAVAYQTELLKGKEGFMPYADIPGLVSEYNQSRGIVFKGVTLTHEAVKPTQVENSTVKTLEYWFNDASKEDQQAFLEWAKKNQK